MKSTILFLVLILSRTIVNAQENASKPFILGEIVEIKSLELGETRILNIYLPEGYKSNDSTKSAVTYLLDGSADEDFIHVVGLYQFNSFEWINRAPKSIVVGIANKDRQRDFTFPTKIESDRKKYPTMGHSDKFISFIEKELQPFIEKKYKTNSTRTIIGESLGGLLATEILFKKPELFNKYIIISPSLWWDDGSLLNQSTTLLEEFSKQIDIYIAVGREGLTPGEKPRVMEDDVKSLADKIRKINNKNINVRFDFLTDENHATISHQAILNAIKVIYREKE